MTRSRWALCAVVGVVGLGVASMAWASPEDPTSDLEVTALTPGPVKLGKGDPGVVRFQVKNNGPDAIPTKNQFGDVTAGKVKLTVYDPPNGADVVSATLPGGTCTIQAGASCDRPTLNVGETVVLEVGLSAPEEGTGPVKVSGGVGSHKDTIENHNPSVEVIVGAAGTGTGGGTPSACADEPKVTSALGATNVAVWRPGGGQYQLRVSGTPRSNPTFKASGGPFDVKVSRKVISSKKKIKLAMIFYLDAGGEDDFSVKDLTVPFAKKVPTSQLPKGAHTLRVRAAYSVLDSDGDVIKNSSKTSTRSYPFTIC